MTTESVEQMHSEFTSHYGQRLSRLEEKVGNIENTIDGVATSIREIGHRLSESQKAPWQTMITAAGLIISIMSVVGVLSLTPINRVNAEQQAAITVIENRQYDALMEYGQRVAILEEKARVGEMSDNNLDTVLQREMRLLDEVLQREMRLLDASQRERIDGIEQVQSTRSEDRYTASQAEADQRSFEREINRLEDKLDSHRDIPTHDGVGDIDRRLSTVEGRIDRD